MHNPDNGRADHHAALQRIITFYQQLTPETLQQIDEIYAADARFKDPFNDVVGPTAIRAIFEHMYRHLQQPQFRVVEQLLDGEQAMLGWELQFHTAGYDFTINGVTHLRFNPTGKVVLHRDYWDSSEELFAKWPFIGGLFRWLARRLSAER